MMGQGSYTYVGGPARDTVQVTINDVPYTITEDMKPHTSLNVFIRDHALLSGTKSMCQEGGCGVCIVSAEIHGEILAINSCLVPILICNGWKITTVEGIGSRKMGYHKIQTTLANMNGSQCGYCSPGMAMNFYSLLKGNKTTMKEIENSFGGNICRCTGYRPILEAFKSLASDAEPEMIQRIQDIEDIHKVKRCPRSSESYTGICNQLEELTVIEEIRMKFDNVNFYKVLDLDKLFTIFSTHPNATYVLNGGNTAHGVYRQPKPEIYIDLNDISELRRIEKTADSLVLGGNVTLLMIHNAFIKYCEDPGFHHLRYMADHVDLIATVPVRNIGSLAGNLMIKHKRNEFPSDLFLILETAGAAVHILQSPGEKTTVNLMDFLRMDMNHKIIYSVVLPALSPDHVYRSYKVMPRAQNAHACINAGFLFKLNAAGFVQEKPNIIIGGISPQFLHAEATENFLNGKSLLDKNVFKLSMDTLDSEVNPDHVLPDYSPQFRKTLAQALFYKFVLSLKSEEVDEKLRSGGTSLKRELSRGTGAYETNETLWPLNKPLPKLEALHQISGEAEYINDIPPQRREVFCAFVTSEVADAKIASIDAAEALAMRGVISFISAKDVPGKNLCIDSTNADVFVPNDEVLFADGCVTHAGQAIGVICAEDQLLAHEAAKKVRVHYTDIAKGKPVITCQDAINCSDKSRIKEFANVPAARKGTNPVQHVVKGTFNCGAQYHYTMEPQSCICIPTEDGLEVYPSSHYIDLVHCSIASCLGIPNNRIKVIVRRLGGTYGAKLSRNTQVSCACAVTAYILNRPVRLIMSIESNMTMIGKRPPVKFDYEVGVDSDGVIQYLDKKTWHNAGASFNDSTVNHAIFFFNSSYNNSTWRSVGYDAITDVPCNTYARGPGATEAIPMVENMMEHIAHTLGKDAMEVRFNNMLPTHKTEISKIVANVKESSDYNVRLEAVNLFNKENRWKKRGMSLMPITYPIIPYGQWHFIISVYARDGTVAVMHGGIECGQGINTKVAQVVAYTLGISLDMISVRSTDNFAAPNHCVTGGSYASEGAAGVAIRGCKQLLARLAPVKEAMKDATWKELVYAAYLQNINLCVQTMVAPDASKIYPVYAVAVTEVEIDILTGQHLIRRVDILEDTGRSVNPDIDRGQVEGAFIMGIGYWTCEDLVYDPDTALLVNNRTWNYKVPGAKDIPVDFRVTLRDIAPTPLSVLGAKGVGEPPLSLSYSVVLAIKHALNSARQDAGDSSTWYQLDGPATIEKILLLSLTAKDQMVL